MADQPRKRISESGIARLFCYVLFGISSLMLMFSLSAGWNWRAWLVGTFIYGGLAIAMYRQEERRKENLAVTRGVQSRPSQRDLSDDDDEDPSQPPTRIR